MSQKRGANRWAAAAERRRAEMVQLLYDLITLPSENPPGNEQAVAAYLCRYLTKHGAEVELQEVAPNRPNLIATWRFGDRDPVARRPTVALVSHLDVVPANGRALLFQPSTRAGRVWGRGACDAKGPIAAMIMAARCMEEAPDMNGGTLVLAALMGEETGGAGARAWASSGLRPDLAVIGEPTNLTLVTGHRGKASRIVTFQGRPAHAAQAYRGLNAIAAAARFISLLGESDRSESGNAGDPSWWPTQITPTTIGGGIKSNVVPAECRVEVDCRLAHSTSLEQIDRQLLQLAHETAASWPGMTVRIEPVGLDRIPIDIGVDSPLVRWAQDAVARAGGILELGCSYPAATDQGVLVTAGIPTFTFGPGDLADAHTDDENVAVADLVQATATCAALIHAAFSDFAPPVNLSGSLEADRT